MNCNVKTIKNFLNERVSCLQNRESELRGEGREILADMKQESIFELKCILARIEGHEEGLSIVQQIVTKYEPNTLKPIEDEEGGYLCPACKGGALYPPYVTDNKHAHCNYCNECGQKLDWDDYCAVRDCGK